MKTNTYWLDSLLIAIAQNEDSLKKHIRATISNKCSSDNKFLLMYLSNHWLHVASLPLFTINPSTEFWMMTTLRHNHASRAIFSTDLTLTFGFTKFIFTSTTTITVSNCSITRSLYSYDKNYARFFFHEWHNYCM